jgi:CubicO group peptidase (beta-lactamase class C family)
MPAGIEPADLADWERISAAVAALEPLWESGKAVGYHTLTHGWITGPLIEKVSGQPVADFIRTELFAPLGIEDDFYLGLPAEAEARVAPLEMSAALRNADPPKPDSFAAKAVPPPFYPLGEIFNRSDVRRAVVPSAGGVANARALAKLYAALIGEVDGVRLLPAERVKKMTELQTDAFDLVLEDANPKAIGYFLGDVDSPMGMRLTAFGHPGYGGSVAFADPEYGFAFALLKNRLTNDDVEPQVALAAARAARKALGIPEVGSPE